MRVSIGAVIALLAFTSAAAASGAGALDGKIFSGELGKLGASTGDPDTLTFEKGSFVSAACVPFGFQGTPYEVSQSKGATAFTAKAVNSKGETMEWKGTLRGEALEATALHRTSSGETETYWFKGKAAASKTGDAPKKAEHPEHPEHPKK